MVQIAEEAATAEDVVMSFLLASRALVGVAARSLAETGDVTLPQFRALVLLSSQPGMAVSDLAAELDVHPTTATRLVDRLVRKRLVRRNTLAVDRRIVQLFLTAPGRRLVDRVTERRVKDITAIASRIPPETWAEVTQSLMAFTEATGEPIGSDLFAWPAHTR